MISIRPRPIIHLLMSLVYISVFSGTLLAQQDSITENYTSKELKWLAKNGISTEMLRAFNPEEVSILTEALDKREFFQHKFTKKLLPLGIGGGLLVTGIVIANIGINQLLTGIVIMGSGITVVIVSVAAGIVSTRHLVHAKKILSRAKDSYFLRNGMPAEPKTQ